MSRANFTSDVLQNCPSQEMLRSFLQGELETTTDFAEHLETCVSCQKSLDQLSRDSTLWPRGPVPTPWTPTTDLLQQLHALPETEVTRGISTLPAGTENLPAMAGYRLVGVLGQGGMGVVYEGIQENLGRSVALKTLRADKVNDELRARLRREAEAIARLNHPNIVQIYEVGEWQAPTGGPRLPYLAMERVVGKSLGQWLAGQPQAPELAAEITEILARAIHAAHEAGIVHRDLKPSNVLVQTGQPDVAASSRSTDKLRAEHTVADGPKPAQVVRQVVLKITDFGLAKDVEAGSSLTDTGQVVGTPNYMAPEQVRARSEEIGPATDIYALGAMLYEMLTSRPAFVGKTPMEILLQVISVDPVSPQQLLHAVPRDLDTICMKCLEKDPRKRYVSAQELAEDVQRFRRGEPILARPVGPMARWARWCRRKPAVAGLWAAVASLLLGAIAVAFWYQFDRAARASEELTRQTEALRKRELAEQAISEALRQGQGSHEQLEAELRRPGSVVLFLNDPRRWLAPIEAAKASLERAAALKNSADTPLSEDLLRDFQGLAGQILRDDATRRLALKLEKIRLDRSTWIDGRFDFALALRDYLAAFEEAGLCLSADGIGRERPLVLNTRLIQQSIIKEQLLASLDDWALAAIAKGQKKLASQLFASARAADPDPWRDRIRSLDLRGDHQALEELADQAVANEAEFGKLSPAILHVVGQLLNAGAANRKAVLWLQQAQMWHPADFWLNLALGNVLLWQQPTDAAGYYRTALAVRKHSGAAWNNLGIALRLQKNFPAARHALQKAVEVEPRNAHAWSTFGVNLLDQNDIPAAVAACKKAVEFEPQSAGAWNNLGVARARNQDRPGAIEAYRKAIHLEPKVAKTWYNLGNAFRLQKDYKDAIEAYRKALEFEPNYAEAWGNLGIVLRARNDIPGAMEAYQKAIAIDPKNANAWTNLGSVYYAQRDWPAAAQAHRQAIEAEPNHAIAWYRLGLVLNQQKDLAAARDAYQKAVEHDPNFVEAWINLGNSHTRHKDEAAALAAFKTAVKIDPKHPNLWANLGAVYIKLQDYPNASEAYRKALHVDPTKAANWKSLGEALRKQKLLPSAVEAYEKAIALSPKMASAHGGLGLVYRDQGRFADAVTSFKKGLPLASLSERDALMQLLHQCENLLALDKRLPLVLKGEKTNPSEQLALADLCYRYKERPADAVHFYIAVFAARKALVEDPKNNHRTSAACAAIRASTSASADTAGQAGFRRQALEWLRADHALGAAQLIADPPRDLTLFLDKLLQWRKHSDLAAVREPGSLDLLPEVEKKSWLAFWSDVEQLERKIRAQIAGNKSG